MKRLVLVGGGHAHLSVLRAMAQRRPKDVELTLITPSAHQNYSGMLPGWISGHYAQTECRVDLRPLAEAAGVEIALAAKHAFTESSLDGQVDLIAALSGAAIRPYHPKPRSLYLRACGPRYAIASWGRWSAEGQWVWKWKDWIDRGFIQCFSMMPATKSMKLLKDSR